MMNNKHIGFAIFGMVFIAMPYLLYRFELLGVFAAVLAAHLVIWVITSMRELGKDKKVLANAAKMDIKVKFLSPEELAAQVKPFYKDDGHGR